ncbi:hypothetical protein H7F36_16130 [Variovorax sp. PAMC28562]|uniref:hypothetical protein n=1 Tax=Variovorax sp. PAMC28562 TaxID=2762323 RepID=UPI00164DD51C|nr:hypothetical protein [Variovorax sp. PAMC28562]QNK72708.1 hypothetical protein H7F36_16130 [Variovorax sp. PAMC28562]
MTNIAETKLSLKYHGQAVEDGRVDVYSAAANMTAFSDFVTEAGKVLFGPDVVIEAEMAGFHSGCIQTDIVFNVVGPALSLISTVNLPEWLSIIKGAFTLWKHLKGQPPVAMVPTTRGDEINVTNADGKVIIFNRSVINLVLNEGSSKSVQEFVGKALAKEGIDSLEVLTEEVALAVVGEGQAGYFKDVRPDEPVSKNEFEFALSIEGPEFKEGKKWRFSDGNSSFLADIEDQEFLKRVDHGEPFAKGEILRVLMRIEQTRQGVNLTTKRAVVKVIEHLRRQQQVSLGF